jgi:hypothetical protein
VTDAASEEEIQRRKTLEAAVSAAAHELRNALNGLLVNLEVVRSMARSSGFSAEPFMTQALSQSEEAASLAEAAIAVMKLFGGALGDGEPVVWTSSSPRQIAIDGGSRADSVVSALEALSRRGVLTVETSGSTVILRIPEESPKSVPND